MFGRTKDEAPHSVPVEEEAAGSSRRKKGPTPSRKQAQARNYRPVVSDRAKMTKAERKARDKELKARRDKEWRAEQLAMKTGDDRHMPVVHKGPERRFARDYIDARLTLSSLFMPLALVLVLLLFVQVRWPMAFFLLTIACYALFAVMLVDSAIAGHNAKILVENKFGLDRTPARIGMQMYARTFYPRRWRLPKPQVRRGEYPEGGTPADLKEARRNHKENKKILKGKA